MNRRRAVQIGTALFGLLVLIVLGTGLWAVVQVRRPLPKLGGSETVAGLERDVDIYRDEFGVPHIYAKSESDMFFAQGFVHAQDRFWQMEFWRHVGQGRVSEIVGAPTVETDKFIRTLGWNRIATDLVAFYEAEEPEYYAILEAYSAGVNAYIEANRGSLSVNATILQLVNDPWEIEPWSPRDTVAWGIVMAYDLSGGHLNRELDQVKLIQELGEANVETLLPGYPYGNRPVIAPTNQLNPSNDSDNEADEADETTSPIDWSTISTDIIGEIPETGFAFGNGSGIGSNNWVVSGDHTQTGQPLLANDPHLGIQLPSIWYEVGLHAPGYDVVGFSFAGVPGVIVGHNNDIAWGVTNVNPDIIDLYIEKINPSNRLQYEFEGEWRDMEVIVEVIKVNGGENVNLEVLVTHHGPIINDIYEEQTDVLAMRWTAFENSRVLQSVILLNQAKNYDDFRDALQFWDIPAQNFVYADKLGNIAYQMPGLIPIRENGDGRTPVQGWTGENEWVDWIPYEELPALFNPDTGYIVTANHAVVDTDYPYYISDRWVDGDRGQRIIDMLESVIERGNINSDDFALIQNDSYSLMADSYMPLFANLSSSDGDVQAAIERMRGWDRQLRRNSVPAALFEIWYIHLTAATLEDEVGEQLNRVRSSIFFHQIASQPDAIWWDDVTTDVTETQADIMLAALEETILWFEENVGPDQNEWTWGQLHTATFVSNPLGQSGIGPIEAMVNLGPVPVDGGRSTINANSYSFGNPAAVTGHPSMRMIVDLADFDNSLSIHPTGQSGHPYSPHYDDMLPLWQEGTYHQMRYSRALVEADAIHHLVLKPAGE